MDAIPLDVVGVIADYCTYISRVCFSMTCRRMRRKIRLVPDTKILLVDGRERRTFLGGCGPYSILKSRSNNYNFPYFAAGYTYISIREREYTLEYEHNPRAHRWLYRLTKDGVVIGELINPHFGGRKTITQRAGFRPPMILVRLAENIDYKRNYNRIQLTMEMTEYNNGIAHRAEILRRVDRVGKVVIPSDRRKKPGTPPTDDKIPPQDL